MIDRARSLARIPARRPKTAAAVFGALSAAALPPLFLFPVLFVTLSGLIAVSRKRSLPGVFACGWWFGFGYALAGLYWISFAFLVRGGDVVAMIPAALLALAAAAAFFPALALTAWAWTVRRRDLKGVGAIALFAWFWIVGEWLQGRWIADFPWNPIGTAWGFHPMMIQSASLGGVWLLSFLAVFAATLPAARDRRPWLPLASALALIAAIAGYGGWRLASHPPIGHQPILLHIVQANIDPYAKHDPSLKADHFDRQWRMSRDSLMAKTSDSMVDVVIWPEDSFFHAVQSDVAHRQELGSLLAEGGVALVGGLRFSVRDRRLENVWNSLYAVDRRGEILGVYDKHRLVPFGEYVPWREYLGLDKLTPGQRDFSAGEGMAVLGIDPIPPLAPLICYEAIFSARVVAEGAPRPQWILNVTNDGWFGRSSGPWQHFTLARLRAVEEGLPLVRAANTGISAVIDPYGRILAMLSLNEIGVLRVPLPNPAPEIPLYGRYGDIGFFASVSGLIGGWLLWRGRRRRR